MRAPWKVTNPSAAFDVTLQPVHAIMGRSKPLEGQVGIEVEVEGNQFPKDDEYHGDEKIDMDEEFIPHWWKYTHDGSLRGDDNAEYILKKPISFSDVPEALEDLWKMFADYGSVLDESNRTSVHVHLNAQGWHLNRLASFLGLYFSVEEILVNWCGDHRVGNLFCLRAKDAPAIVNRARKFIKNGDLGVFDDGLHYAGVNLEALKKKGSIEIRSMRGATEYQPIVTWVNILERIYNLSGEFDDPRLVVAQFSGGGALNYFNFVLGEHAETVLSGSGMTTSEVVRSLTEGIRLAQSVCYSRNWGDFKPAKGYSDPFGRSPAKVAQNLNNDPVASYIEEFAVVNPTGSSVVYQTQTMSLQEAQETFGISLSQQASTLTTGLWNTHDIWTDEAPV